MEEAIWSNISKKLEDLNGLSFDSEAKSLLFGAASVFQGIKEFIPPETAGEFLGFLIEITDRIDVANLNDLRQFISEGIAKQAKSIFDSANNIVGLGEIVKEFTETVEEVKRLGLESAEKKQSIDALEKEAQIANNKIASDVLSLNYLTYSKSLQTTTKVYDAVAIVFSILGLVALVFTVLTFYAPSPEEIEYVNRGLDIIKLTVTLGIFTVAGFLFRRGSFYQREAKQAKRIALTFQTYRSFISVLPTEKQEDVIMRIAKYVYAQNMGENTSETNTESRELSSILEQVKDIVVHLGENGVSVKEKK